MSTNRVSERINPSPIFSKIVRCLENHPQLKSNPYFRGNIGFLLPSSSTININGQIYSHIARPFVDLLSQVHDISNSGEIFSLLEGQGLISDKINPEINLGEQEAYRAMVWRQGQNNQLTKHGLGLKNEYEIRDLGRAVTASLYRGLAGLEFPGIRSFVFNIERETCEELDMLGERIPSKYAEGPRKTEGGFEALILDLLKNPSDVNPQRLIGINIIDGEGWTLLHIPDRKAMSWGQEELIRDEVSERQKFAYGRGNAEEVAFLVVGDISKNDNVLIFKLNTWPLNYIESQRVPPVNIIHPLFDLISRRYDDLVVAANRIAEYFGDAITYEKSRQRIVDLGRDPVCKSVTSHKMTVQMIKRYFEGLKGVRRKTEKIRVVFAVDLDFFKNVNDIYGHGTGDSVLDDASSLMVEAFRKGDLKIAGRVGGEEFILIGEFTLEEFRNLPTILERMRQSFHRHIFITDQGKPLGHQYAPRPELEKIGDIYVKALMGLGWLAPKGTSYGAKNAGFPLDKESFIKDFMHYWEAEYYIADKPAITPQRVTAIYEKLIALFRENYRGHGITFSLGAAVLYPGEEWEAVRKRADDASYKAKGRRDSYEIVINPPSEYSEESLLPEGFIFNPPQP